MADKSDEVIVHARHEWLINQHQDQPWKNDNVYLSILGLVHKSGNLVSWFSALKIVYIHLSCTVDEAELQFSTRKREFERKKTMPNSKYEKINSMTDEGM